MSLQTLKIIFPKIKYHKKIQDCNKQKDKLMIKINNKPNKYNLSKHKAKLIKCNSNLKDKHHKLHKVIKLVYMILFHKQSPKGFLHYKVT